MASDSPTPALPGPAQLVLGVVGCGVMGRGIAQIAATAGTTVKLVDAQPGAADRARDEVRATFAKLAGKGKLSAEQAAAASARLSASELAGLGDCMLVVEAIVEDLDAKRALFAQLEDVLAPDAVLATNTSSLSVTAIAAGLRHPQRVAGFHFFNPVPLMKIVEVVGGFHTAPAVVEALLALGRAWGHTAVAAKDTPGFIVNHAGRGYGTEGLRILAESVTDVATLDAILRDGAGFRLGPGELMDLTGLDVSHPVMESIYRQYYEEPRFRPQWITRQMLAAGALGRKSGQGFYRYLPDGNKQLSEAASAPGTLPEAVWLSQARPQLAARIQPLIAAAGVAQESGTRPSERALCIVTPLGDDATACCIREGLDARRTVAIDAVFDPDKRRVLMSTPATEAGFLDQARALFGALGAPVSVIRDSAGMVTQRVLAHIVNVGCEIAQQGIAHPQDIDCAVSLGLGYPLGPLAWGDRIGAATVLEILENLQASSGDPRYRPSPWLRRRAQLGLSLLTEEHG